ncbi:MAG: zf-HC2 domain-containing protein [Nitrospinota bacterium]|nr:zf-HC2 domain-containing protein [Nitrospinota bacterium]
MNCEECRQLIWDYDRDDLSDDNRDKVREHINECSKCQTALMEVRKIQVELRSPPMINVAARAQAVLNETEKLIYDKPGQPALNWGWRPLTGVTAIAATVLFMVISILPGESTAISLEKLTTQHRICVLEGHHKNYRCDTEVEFGEMMMSELGLAARPFETPGDAFKKGDICRIGGAKVAHALLEIKGETVSYFRLFDANETLKNDGGWIAHSSDVWWKKAGGRLVVLRRFGRGDYGFYTGNVEIGDIADNILESKTSAK